MRKFTIFLFLILFVNFIELVKAFDVEISEDKVTIATGEIKEIFINIKSEIDDRIIVYPKELTVWMSIEDIGPIRANENKTIKFILSPFPDSTPGTYKVSLIFSSIKTGETKEKNLFITLLKGTLPIIKEVYMSQKFKAGEDIDANIIIFNPGIKDEKNILLQVRIISSQMKVINEFFDVFDIKTNETKKIEKKIPLKYDLYPGKYYLELVLLKEGNIIEKRVIEFLIEAQPKIEKTIETKDFLFRNRVIITIKNVGNAIAYNESLSINLHPISRLSYKQIYGPKPKFYNNTAVWTFSSINVGEEIIIEYELDYTYILIFLILILLISSYYFYKLRSVIIRKTALKKKDNLIDIVIEVKNNTNKDVEKVVITDRVPILFKIRQVIGPKPIMKSSEKYYEMKWKIGKLKRGEERIISYKVQEIIKVEGELSLPGAEVTYLISNKTFTNKSGNVSLRV